MKWRFLVGTLDDDAHHLPGVETSAVAEFTGLKRNAEVMADKLVRAYEGATGDRVLSLTLERCRARKEQPVTADKTRLKPCHVCADGKRLSVGWECDVCGRVNWEKPLTTLERERAPLPVTARDFERALGPDIVALVDTWDPFWLRKE